jgi:hypothetical protein
MSVACRLSPQQPEVDVPIGDIVACRHDLRAEEPVGLRWLPKSLFVFTSERGTPFTTGFGRMVERARIKAKLGYNPDRQMKGGSRWQPGKSLCE